MKCDFYSAQNEYTNRRMSDPSSSWNYFQHGSLKRTGVRKSRSGLENVETIDNSTGYSNSGYNEVEAGNFEDGKQHLWLIVLFHFLVKSVTVATCRLVCNLYPATVENALLCLRSAVAICQVKHQLNIFFRKCWK